MNLKNIRQKKLIIINFLNRDTGYKTKIRELKLLKLTT
jgi:hypothetical protein